MSSLGTRPARPGESPGAGRGASARSRALPDWWPLAALVILGAALRFSTIDLQSLWFDEAFTPVHTLRASLGSTFHEIASNENTPPLWYVLIWLVTRVFGTGAIALRSVSAIAGTAAVAVGWGIGRELSRTRRTAVLLAAIMALNPFFIWYSQEARAYELYTCCAGLSFLFFLRARRDPAGKALAWWSGSSVLALLSEYFAIFLIIPEALLLLAADSRRRSSRAEGRELPRRALLAWVPVVICGAALLPLLIAQGGRGTQWIEHWSLSSRLIQIPGYYLLGTEGQKLGHGLLALSAIPCLAAIVLLVGLFARRRLSAGQYERLLMTLGLGLVAVLMPFILALAGADYLSPRNLIADWVPLSAGLAFVLTLPMAGRSGVVIAGLVCFGAFVVVIATDLSPRLQRGDWKAVAGDVRRGSSERAIVTIHLGSAPLEYYLPGWHLRELDSSRSVRVREVEEVGYRPLRAGAGEPPTPAFRPAGHSEVHGLLVYRFEAATPQLLSARTLGAQTLTNKEAGETLVPASVPALG